MALCHLFIQRIIARHAEKYSIHSAPRITYHAEGIRASNDEWQNKSKRGKGLALEFADSLCVILRYSLIGLFLICYITGWAMSLHVRRSPVRSLILRWAAVPLLIFGLIYASYCCFKNAGSGAWVTSFMMLVVASMIGAAAFSLWLQRGGGKELFYVPLAFAKFGWDEPNAVTLSVSELSSGDLDAPQAFLLSVLPAVLIFLAIILLLWESSRSVGS